MRATTTTTMSRKANARATHSRDAFTRRIHATHSRDAFARRIRAALSTRNATQRDATRRDHTQRDAMRRDHTQRDATRRADAGGPGVASSLRDELRVAMLLRVRDAEGLVRDRWAA
jgi:hypothetical protein